MNMRATTLGGIAEDAPTMSEAQRNWRIAAIALLSTRFIQGFIYWGGGSRRFVYAPSKLHASVLRHGSSYQLHVDSFLPALRRRHSVQPSRNCGPRPAHDEATDSPCGA